MVAVRHKLEAAVFDVDGMLLDNREWIFQAYEFAFTKYGHPLLDRRLMAKQVGKSLSEALYTLVPDGNNVLLAEAHNDFLDKNVELIKEYKGLHEMLTALTDSGLKLAVFSSRQAAFKDSLDHAGITRFFDAIVDASMHTRHKPHPEGLLKALEILKIKPQRAAMLGDAAVDIRAGKAADVALTIGITHGFGTLADLKKAKPDYIVNSLMEIPRLLIVK